MAETFLDNHPKINKMAYPALGVVVGLLSRLDPTVADKIAPKAVNGAAVFPYHPVNSFVNAMERFAGTDGKNKIQVARKEAARNYFVTTFLPSIKGGN